MELQAELERIAAAATGLAGPDEALEGVIPTEPEPGRRLYLCSFSGPLRTWAAVDEGGGLVTERARVRAAVSIAALCELAEESAALRVTEDPEGIEEAEEAALAVERVIRPAPRLASPGYLDELGLAVRRLELALGGNVSSPFVEAMKASSTVVDELELEVEAGYKGELT